MKRLRHAEPGDLDDLLALAEMSAGGITSFPPDRNLLQAKIAELAHFFVLEDLATGKVIGCAAIRRQATGDLYRVEKDVLHLERIEGGPSEVSTLFLHRDHREGGLGRLLSYGRFLFIALHPNRFEPVVIARMRGVLDDEGTPLFYPELHLSIPFAEADLNRYSDPHFVKSLGLPQNLPATNPAIGKPHPSTEPAVQMLEREGFAYRGQVDIFDAGPVLECAVSQLWTVRHRQTGVVQVVDRVDGKPQIVANHRSDFRACFSPLDHQEMIRLPQAAADALEVSDGETISYRAEAA